MATKWKSCHKAIATGYEVILNQIEYIMLCRIKITIRRLVDQFTNQKIRELTDEENT